MGTHELKGKEGKKKGGKEGREKERERKRERESLEGKRNKETSFRRVGVSKGKRKRGWEGFQGWE